MNAMADANTESYLRISKTSFGLGLPEAIEAAQNHPFWKMLTKYYGSSLL